MQNYVLCVEWNAKPYFLTFGWYCVGSAAKQKADVKSTPPRPTSNPPSLPVQLSVKPDVSPIDTKPLPSSAAKEKPVSSERRASSDRPELSKRPASSDRPESSKRPASSVATAADQPVAKRPMSSSCERSSSDSVSNMTVSTSSAKTSITPVSVPHKRAPSFEAEGLLYIGHHYHNHHYYICLVNLLFSSEFSMSTALWGSVDMTQNISRPVCYSSALEYA